MMPTLPDDPPDYPHGSPAARSVFSFILHRGGTMRVTVLTRLINMKPEILVDAVNELVDRRWMTVVWRKSAHAASDMEESRPLAAAERVVTTRWGRHRYRSTWPTY